jgi:hypothetical protein
MERDIVGGMPVDPAKAAGTSEHMVILPPIILKVVSALER